MVPNPLSQSDAYANTLSALGTEVRIDRVAETGRCLIQTRHFPCLGPINLISRGPVGSDQNAASEYLRSLQVKGPLIVNTGHRAPSTKGCFIRLTRSKSVALLSLSTRDRMRANLHQNWRNALKRAETVALRISNTPYQMDQHKWLIDADQAQQKIHRYRNWPERVLSTFASVNPGQIRVISTYHGKTPVSGMIILCHRPWATYHLAVNTDLGRNANAHHLMIWQAMLWLANRGYTTLDLGLITGPPGLDRFKLRTGAVRHDLGGTWLRLPKPLMPQLSSIQVPSGQKA